MNDRTRQHESTAPPSLATTTPRVSVLMPIYNACDYLAEAVDSILTQTLWDLELVAVDDGSTDRSLDVLRDFERRDGRMRVFARPHLGYVRQLNFGLGVSRGRYIARMDSDDVAYPRRLEIQVEHLESNPQTIVLGGAYDLTDAAGRMLRRHVPPADDATLQEMCLTGQTPIGHPTAIMRRASLVEVGGYDESLETAEDNDLWLRLGERGELACVLEPVIRYRQHDKSVSEQRAAEQLACIRAGCEAAYARRGLDRAFIPPPAWRPTGEAGRYDFLLKYGWWALSSAQRGTAFRYGLKAIRQRPLKREPWMLIYSTCKPLRNPPPPIPGRVADPALAAPAVPAAPGSLIASASPSARRVA